MPVQIRIENVQFHTVPRGIPASFPDVGVFTPNLAASINETVLAIFKASLTWFSGTDQGYTVKGIELSANTGRLIRSSGSYLDDGFRLGDRFVSYTDWNRRFDPPTASGYAQNASFIADITFMAEDGSYFDFEVDSFINGYAVIGNVDGADNYGIWADAELTENLHNSAIFRFGLIGNDEDYNNTSLQTDESQSYYQPEIASSEWSTSETDLFIPQGVLRGWLGGLHQGVSPDELSLIQSGGIVRPPSLVGSELNAATYVVAHYFTVNPLFLIGQLENFETGDPPSYLAGDNSLKYVFDLEFRKSLSNPNIRKSIVIDNLLSSVGWRNENFNGFNSNYRISDVRYSGGSASEDGVAIQGLTRVFIDVEKLDSGTFISDPVFLAAYIQRIPNTEDEYQGTETNLFENFLFDVIYQNSNGSGTVQDRIFKSMTSALAGSDPSFKTLTITLELSYSTTEQLKLSNTDRYELSIQIENQNLTIDVSDRVILTAELGTYQKGDFIDGLITWDNLELYNVNETQTDTGSTSLSCYNESGLFLDFDFKLDLSKNAVLTDLRFQLVAKNASGSFFLLDEFVFDLSSVQIRNGIQEININNDRAYLLPDGDDFNKATIEVGSNDGTFQSYRGTLGQKIKWQEWLQNNAVDTIFYDESKPNNNLNFKTSNYSNLEGYEIFILAQSSLTGVDDLGSAGEGFDQTFTGEISVTDYQVGFGNVLSATIEFLDPDSLAVSDSILQNKNTLLRTTFEMVAITDIANFWAVHRIQQTNSTGDNIEELTTNKGIQTLLKPVSGESFLRIYEDSGNIITECLIDFTRLNDQVGYDVSAEIAEKSTIISGNFVTTAEGDLVLTAEGDLVLTAEN